MKLVVTDSDFPDLELERALAHEADVELESAQVRTPAEVIDVATGADALLVQYAEVDEAVFDALDLQIVGRYGIGVDSIDLDAATAAGVPVVNVPDYCLDEVSVHAFSLLLACVREVSRLDREIRDGTWDWTLGKPIHRFAGQTLGLAGFGKIPRELARKARAFDLDVVAYDPFVSADDIEAHDAKKVEFNELLEQSDFMSVHVPLTDETEGMFDADAFGAMKASAVIVNTARGPVIDTDDLFDALVAGDIAGAGLDVMPDEPPSNWSLFELDNVVATPHIAWYSEESHTELRRRVTEDILGVLRGDQPNDPVNEVGTE
jgi:D-3-phosphoglycerate dehydrogenase